MSLRDELAQVLGYTWDSANATMSGPAFWQLAADAVIAHLGLTEETAVRWPWSQTPELNVSRESAEWRAANVHTKDGAVVRHYVTPWEDA